LRRAGVLAAGEGSRLRAAGLLTPKPLLEVRGVPLIERTLRGLIRAGAREVFCIVNEEAREVERFLLRGDFGARVEVLVKTTPSSLASLLALKEWLSGEGFLLATADAVLDPKDWVGFARAASRIGRPKEALLGATTFVDDEDPLWLRANPSGEVLALGAAAKGSGCVTAGLYAFPPDVFQAAEATAKRPGARLRDLLIDLLQRGWRLGAHPIRKAVDVDRPEDIRAAEVFVDELEGRSWRGSSSAS
jgi:NDP-sugar pyrophosphorylase family protein